MLLRNENRAAQDGETNLRTPGKDSKSIPGDDAHVTIVPFLGFIPEALVWRLDRLYVLSIA